MKKMTVQDFSTTPQNSYPAYISRISEMIDSQVLKNTAKPFAIARVKSYHLNQVFSTDKLYSSTNQSIRNTSSY